MNYSNALKYINSIYYGILPGTVQIRSTVKTIDSDHTFYSDNKSLHIYMSTYANSPNTLNISNVPFRHVTSLQFIFENTMASWTWNKLMKLRMYNSFLLFFHHLHLITFKSSSSFYQEIN
jgi:hypothetical protein